MFDQKVLLKHQHCIARLRISSFTRDQKGGQTNRQIHSKIHPDNHYWVDEQTDIIGRFRELVINVNLEKYGNWRKF